jgi:hypothetical protein
MIGKQAPKEDELMCALAVRPGEHITGVRLVLALAAGVVAGRIRVEGGQLPPGVRVRVILKQTGGSPSTTYPEMTFADADSAGRFVADGLLPGTYSVGVDMPDNFDPEHHVSCEEQTVEVANDAQATVTLVLKLKAKSGEGEEQP